MPEGIAPVAGSTRWVADLGVLAAAEPGRVVVVARFMGHGDEFTALAVFIRGAEKAAHEHSLAEVVPDARAPPTRARGVSLGGALERSNAHGSQRTLRARGRTVHLLEAGTVDLGRSSE